MTAVSSAPDVASADRARANHTGVQAISTVEGLQAALDAAAGGDQLYVQAAAPAGAAAPYVWVQTGLGASGSDVTFWVEDGL